MGNYLFVVADDSKANHLRQWVIQNDHEVDEEVCVGILPPSTPHARGGQTLYVACGAKSDSSDGLNVFKGYAIDHEGKTIAFSGNREVFAPHVFRPLEGCYFRVQHLVTESPNSNLQSVRLAIGNDIFGQLPLMYMAESGIVAVSDSLFVLTEIRKFFGLPCRIDHEVMLARSWINSITAQLLCDRTPIEGINFATLGTTLIVDILNGSPFLTVKRRGVTELFQYDIKSYRETIIEAGERAVSLIGALLNTSNSLVSLALSGGLDSRVCLAAGLVADASINSADKNQFRIISKPARKDDFFIASLLSRDFGFPLNQPSKAQTVKERIDRIGTWFLHCAGIYDPLYAPKVVVRTITQFNITGHGAELFKGNYGWRSILQIARHIPSVAAIFRDQCESGLELMGIDRNDPWGSEWHYLGFRNAIHSSRAAMSSLFGVRPLFQRKLLGLSRSHLNEFPAPKKGSPSLVSDLLIVLNPDLAHKPFSDSKKNMSEEYVDQRLDELLQTQFGKLTTTKPYTLIGRPQDISSGKPAFFSRLIKDQGFSGDFSAAKIRAFVEKGAKNVPNNLLSSYAPLIELCRHGLTDPIIASQRESTAAGKIMTFLLAD